MFTRYGSNTKVYNQNGSATIKLLTFLAVIGTIGGAMWALFQAFENWTNGVSRTWTPGNNDTLINRGADVFGTVMYLIVGGLMLAVVAPWIIRNWRIALLAPIPGQGQRNSYNVLPDDTEAPGMPPEPSYGLMLDDAHSEHYIDVTHQLTGNAAPARFEYTDYQPVDREDFT